MAEPAARRISVLDTTLRDGAQSEGIIFSLEDKLSIIRLLDDLGVDYIEAGNPASNPKDAELFRFAKEHMQLKQSRLTAFGSTCRVGTDALQDSGLAALIDAGASCVSLFGKSSIFHVTEVIKTSPEENLRIIHDSVAYLVQNGVEVLFDAEHFFDGFLIDGEYALKCLKAAQSAGASWLVLCDTNGGTLPGDIQIVTQQVTGSLNLPVAIHCHNDSGLATAGTLRAVMAGATQVQGTINGYGERCGNANLCEILPNLQLKMHMDCLPTGALTRLTSTARSIGEIANISINEHSPYVGRSAFAHKGGMHIDGVMKNHKSFEHIKPEWVGNHRRYLLSEMAGRGALLGKLSTLAPTLTKDSPEVVAIMEELKQLEADGYSFENATASLELRLLGALGQRQHFFEVLDFQVISRKANSTKNTQAFVKIRVDNKSELSAEEGDGPINALDLALRKALLLFFPCIEQMHLADFKVRVVNNNGTASAVRVYIESTDGKHVWGTVGVSSNIIEAGFIALADSIEYLLLNHSTNWQRNRL